MTGTYIGEFYRVRLACIVSPAAEEMGMLVDGLHPEIIKLMGTKSPAREEEAVELLLTFNDTKDRINRWSRAGNEDRGGDVHRSKGSAFPGEKGAVRPRRTESCRYPPLQSQGQRLRQREKTQLRVESKACLTCKPYTVFVDARVAPTRLFGGRRIG